MGFWGIELTGVRNAQWVFSDVKSKMLSIDNRMFRRRVELIVGPEMEIILRWVISRRFPGMKLFSRILNSWSGHLVDL